ncbi:MAG: hypothetical protein L6Q92_16430 [Phycisphaerae bacterium]|nr:hypothetical protein [Phycisphaerae bacterium]
MFTPREIKTELQRDSRALTAEDRKRAATVLRNLAEGVPSIDDFAAAEFLSSDEGRFLVNVATRLRRTDPPSARHIALALAWLGEVVRTKKLRQVQPADGYRLGPKKISRACRRAADALDPPQAVSQDDKPDKRGYVESPAHPKDYVPATDILATHTPVGLPITMDRLVAIIEDYDSNRVRWTRPRAKNGRPMRNRRSVHVGDWAQYVKRRLPPRDADGYPTLTKAEIDDIESRKAAAHKLKQAQK